MSTLEAFMKEAALRSENRRLKEEIAVYKSTFHSLAYLSHGLNQPRLIELLGIIRDWGHAHGGEFSSEEIEQNIKAQVSKLKQFLFMDDEPEDGKGDFHDWTGKQLNREGGEPDSNK